MEGHSGFGAEPDNGQPGNKVDAGSPTDAELYDYYRLSSYTVYPWIDLGILVATGTLIYVSSLFDAWNTGSESFLYPTYLELFIGGGPSFVAQKQTKETHPFTVSPADVDRITSGVSALAAHAQLGVLYEGRRYQFLRRVRLSLAC